RSAAATVHMAHARAPALRGPRDPSKHAARRSVRSPHDRSLTALMIGAGDRPRVDHDRAAMEPPGRRRGEEPTSSRRSTTASARTRTSALARCSIDERSIASHGAPMPVEISVGPPVLAISQGRTFMVTDLGGEIAADSEQGVFADDTRFLSYYAIFANRERWVRLSSSAISYYAARVYLTNAPFSTEEGDVPGGKLGLTLSRAVCDGIHEDLDVINHGRGAVRFNLEIATRSDFADLFEVKTHRFVRRGRIEGGWDHERGELRVDYENRDFRRSFVFRPIQS